MIIETHSQQEYEETLRLLAVINELRDNSHLHRPIVDDTPWCRVAKVKEEFL